MMPFPRSLIAIGVNRCIRDANKPEPTPPKSLRDCLLTISLAASIHADDKAVRLAAYRMAHVCRVEDQQALAMIFSTVRAVEMVGLILEGMEIGKPKRKRGGKNWNRTAKRASG